jgi:DNA-directed RNA polymerase II subunit RPB2
MINQSNQASQDDLHKLLDLYFSEKHVMYSYHKNSYNQFINEIVLKELQDNPGLIYENITKNFIYKYRFKFSNILLRAPIDEYNSNDEPLTPHDARIKFLSYSSKLMADVQQIQETIDIETNEKTEKILFEDKNIVIAKIPIMFRSRYCTTNLKPHIQSKECDYDPGCYFIIKGSEKVIMTQERIIENKILVFKKKDLNFPDNSSYTCQVYCKRSEDLNSNLQIVSIKMKKDNTLMLTMSNLQEIPIFIMFKALGFVSDKSIITNIIYDEMDIDMTNIIKYSLTKYKDETFKDIKGTICYIRTQEDALKYLITKLKIIGKRFSETNLETREIQKREYLLMILNRDLLPHIKKGLIYKGHYLGLMCNKLLSCYLKRIEIDDRDSMINKRLDTPGILLGQLFRQFYKKMLNDCTKYFRKKNISDTNPINIISQIKYTVIEQGINTGLATGTWGNTKKKGVAQVLQRLTYMQMISALRRVITPQADTSSKIEKMRFVHNTQYGFLDAVETPEHGHNVGTVKHLSNTATITINSSSQPEIISDIIYDKIDDLEDIPPIYKKIYTKIFINGEWLGISKDPITLINFLKSKRRNGEIEKTIGLSHNFNTREIRINCDGGRITRPLLCVNNNKLLVTKEIINEIEIDDRTEIKKITKWNDLLLKYPEIIEYIDVEEQESLMISLWVNDLNKNLETMTKMIKNPNMFGDPVNRYNETVYKKYSHCEFHPYTIFGNISSFVPFSEHNQSPRNYYSFSQSRQALGLYCSNYRYRIDLSYLLFHPQKPLVETRGTKYTGLSDLPCGENCIVAILMYTGYNQEDSIVFNQSSIERGLFRACSYRKEDLDITKNQATGQDEIFTKPDRNKVAGMKDGNYDKLNEKGYIPEEMTIKNGDVIIGKVTPIQMTQSSNKIYKDASLIYKSGVDGVIEKIYTNIKNSDGYEMYNARIRQERIPRTGDKFCSRHGQKGTIGKTLRAEDMPFTSQGIQPDLILNPCCIPSRMTVGQFLEALTCKSSALKGNISQVTPFDKIDMDEITRSLKEHGYDEYGNETLYCGFTGKKMESKIFICPTYYLRLKHLVQDKIHARSRGPATLLTHQPTEGRARDGGLRFGEMERDAMIAHGIPIFLKEKFMDSSDIFKMHICTKCGLIAHKIINKNIYICDVCKTSEINQIQIPYAFKLFMQELMAINILPRLKTKEQEL